MLSGSDGEFLEELYRHGIKGNFDGVSIHPYNEWRDPDDAWQDEWKQWSFLQGIPWIHEIMRDHGDGDKGVWLTEFGFSTCGRGDRWCVDEQQQAEYIKDSFRIARRWDFVKAALVYNLRNKGTDPTGREDQFGLLHRDFSPKPAWNAFREAMAEPPAARRRRPAPTTRAADAASPLRRSPLPARWPSPRAASPRCRCPAPPRASRLRRHDHDRDEARVAPGQAAAKKKQAACAWAAARVRIKAGRDARSCR